MILILVGVQVSQILVLSVADDADVAGQPDVAVKRPLWFRGLFFFMFFLMSRLILTSWVVI